MNTPASLQTSAGRTAPDQLTSESRVDRDSHFNGLFKTKQNLRIEGIAEGEIQCDGMVTVAEGARVKAKITASNVTIAGELEGEVICQGTFQIMPSGQVQATVSARRVVVQEGGFYNGEFQMITDAPAEPPGRVVRDARPTPAERSRESSPSDAWTRLIDSTPPSDRPDKKAGP